MSVNFKQLSALPAARQAATIFHELCHYVHHHLDTEAFKIRRQIAGELGKGIGGWINKYDDAEEQLTITGHLCQTQKAPNTSLRA